MTIAILEKCYKYLKDYYEYLHTKEVFSDIQKDAGYDEGLKRLITYLEDLIDLVRNF